MAGGLKAHQVLNCKYCTIRYKPSKIEETKYSDKFIKICILMNLKYKILAQARRWALSGRRLAGYLTRSPKGSSHAPETLARVHVCTHESRPSYRPETLRALLRLILALP